MLFKIGKNFQQTFLSKFYDTIMVFLFSFLIFNYIIYHVKSDLQLHVDSIRKINDGQIEQYPINFIYYLLVNLFSGFTNSLNKMNVAVCSILSFAVSTKYLISKKILKLSFSLNKLNLKNYKILLYSCCIFFFFPIIEFYKPHMFQFMYFGRLAPFVWHNSTIIASIPVSLLIFYYEIKSWEEKIESNEFVTKISLLVLINIFIKPSFIFVYIPTVILFNLNSISKIGLKNYLIKISPALIGIIGISLQYLIIYFLGQNNDDNQIAISQPFEIYNLFIPTKQLVITFSLSLLLHFASIFSFKEILFYKPFQFSLLLMLFSLLISIFIKEDGSRYRHGNFMWQNVTSTYLLTLSTLMFLISKFENKLKQQKRVYLLKLLLGLHVISGVLYTFKILVIHAYS